MVKEEVLKASDVDISLINDRFEDLTGKTYGDLVILGPYKRLNKKITWVAECSCGNIIKTNRGKVVTRGKTSCVECAEKVLRSNHFTPIDIKIKDLYKVRDNIKIISIKGETFADDWEVMCTICENTYERKYRDLLRGVMGCGCSNINRKGLVEKYEYLKQYCMERTLIFLGWVEDSDTIRVNMYCPKHNNYYEMSYSDIARGQGCRYCGCELLSRNRRHTKEHFIEKAIGVHKGKYAYTEVYYVNSHTKVKILCNSCGRINLQTPANHLSGKECTCQASNGYDSSKPACFYIQSLDNSIGKLGVTNRSPVERMHEQSTTSIFNHIMLYKFFYKDGTIPLKIENKCKKLLKLGVVLKEDMNDGFTETFFIEELDLVLSIVEEVSK
jgi:hypothetical protein